MKWRKALTMAGPLLLASSGFALAATSGSPWDGPLNQMIMLIRVGGGTALGATGTMHFAQQLMQHHEFGRNFANPIMYLGAGVGVYNYPTWAPWVGLSAASVIRLVAHTAVHVAPHIARLAL